jgi:hypothetical protein
MASRGTAVTHRARRAHRELLANFVSVADMKRGRPAAEGPQSA